MAREYITTRTSTSTASSGSSAHSNFKLVQNQDQNQKKMSTCRQLAMRTGHDPQAIDSTSTSICRRHAHSTGVQTTAADIPIKKEARIICVLCMVM